MLSPCQCTSCPDQKCEATLCTLSFWAITAIYTPATDCLYRERICKLGEKQTFLSLFAFPYIYRTSDNSVSLSWKSSHMSLTEVQQILGDKSWHALCIPVHPECVRRGLGSADQSSSSREEDHLFMDLVLCMEAVSCWNRKGPSPNCWHKADSTNRTIV